MKKVVNALGNTVDFNAAVMLMDDDIREALAAEGIENEQEFFDAYCAAHLDKYGEEFVPNTNKAW